MDKFKTLNKKTIIAIIAICILAIVAIVGVVAFLKDDGSATAIDEIAQQEPESENANTNASENAEQSPSATENNSDAQENTSSENTTNNSVMPSESANPTTNTTSQPSTSVAPTTQATGTTTSTTNTNVPNQEYVTSRVEEVERQISEDLAVSWQNLDVAGKFTDVNVEDLGITAVKKAYVIKDKELIPQRAENEDAKTVVPGDEIRYVIEIKNISQEARKEIKVSDSVPAQTSLIDVSNGGTETTVDGVTKIFWTVDFEDGEEVTSVSFIVRVNEDATGTIRNTAVVNGDKTNETHNTIIKTTKESLVSECTETGDLKQVGNVSTVHEGDTISYTITVSNTGETDEKINLEDAIPDGLTLNATSVRVSKEDANIIVEDNKISVKDYTLNAGEELLITFNATVNALGENDYVEDDNGNKVCTKVIDANYVVVNDAEAEDPDGPKYVKKPIIETTKVSEIADCTISPKQLTGSTVHEGDIIRYTITVSNAKGSETGIINLSDELPKGLSISGNVTANLADAQTKIQVTGKTITLTDYKLQAGATLVITFDTVVDDLGTTTNDKGETVKAVSAKLTANKVTVNGIDKEDSNPPTEVKKPNIEISKTSTVADKDYVRVGESFDYIITAKNNGTEKGNAVITDNIPAEFTVDATNIKVDDQVADNSVVVSGNKVEWTITDLAAESSKVLKIRVTAKDINGVKAETTNTATIDNENPLSSTDVDIGKSDIDVTKSSQVVACNDYGMTGSKIDVVHENDEIQYTITAENNGVVSDKINVRDELKDKVEFVEGSLTAKVDSKDITGVKAENGVISLDNYELAAESKLVITFKVRVKTFGLDENGNKTTKATFEANTVYVNNEPTEDPNGPGEIKKPDLKVTKSSSIEAGQYAEIGKQFSYYIVVDNNGDEKGSAVVEDEVPSNLRIDSYGDALAGDTISVVGNKVTWNVNNLPARTSRRIEIKVTPLSISEGKTEETITNTAKITNGPDSPTDVTIATPVISTTKASEVVVCGQYGMIDSEGATKVTTVHEGDEIEYTITISNTGKVAGIVNMNDPLPTGMTFKAGSLSTSLPNANVVVANDKKSISLNDYSLPAGAKLTITFRVTIDPLGKDSNGNDATSAKLSANTVEVNTVKIPDPNPPTDIKKPIINTTKTSVISECGKGQTSGTTVHEGDKIKYTITVSNSGTEYKNINVSDTLKPGVSLLENTISAKDNGNDIQGIIVSTDKRTISLDGYRLEAGHTLTITFEVSVDTLGENVIKATIEANQVTVDTTTTLDDKTYEVVKPNINVTKQVLNTENKDINGETVDVRSTLKYVLVGTNTGSEDSYVTITDDIDISKLTDVTVKGVIRTNETDASTAVTYNKENGKLSWSGLLKKNSGNQVIITIEAKTRILNESELSYVVENTAKYTPEGSSEKTTNKVTNNVKIMIESDKTATVINDEKDGKAEYGDIIEYTITAENKSDSDGKVNIIDPLPTGVEYSNPLDGNANPIVVKVNGTTVVNGTYNDGTISYDGTLKAGAKLTLTFKVKVTSTDLNNNIVNTATINGIDKSATVDVVKKISIAATAEVTNSMDLVLVLDVSGSMKGNRIEALREAATALVNKVFPDGVETDTTVTIITYSANASWKGKFKCDDKGKALKVISGLTNPTGGTNIKKALDETNKLFDNKKLTNKKKVVIFLSDGAPTVPSNSLINSGNTGYSDNKVDGDNSIISAANKLNSNADRVYSIGLGTEKLPNSNRAYVLECPEAVEAITSEYNIDTNNDKLTLTLKNTSSRDVTVTKLTANISGINGVNSSDVTYSSSRFDQGTLTWKNAIKVSAGGKVSLEVNIKSSGWGSPWINYITPEYQIICSNSEHQAMNSVVPFDGVKPSNGKNYHYYSERSLAKFVLKTIGKTKYIPVADGENAGTTANNLSEEFDAILKDSSTTHSTAITSTLPAVLTIKETATVKGDVVLSIGDKSYTYSIDKLVKPGITIEEAGVILSYEQGDGFTLTIEKKETLEQELHIAYTVDKK